MKTGILVAALLLAACHPTRMVKLPDGTEGLVVDCSGTRKNISHCMDKAAKECGGPYEIISQDASSPGGMLLPNSNIIAHAINRSLIVKCKT